MLGLLLIAGLCVFPLQPHWRQGHAIHVLNHLGWVDSMHQAATLARQVVDICQNLSIGAPLRAKLAPGRDGLVGSEVASEVPAGTSLSNTCRRTSLSKQLQQTDEHAEGAWQAFA